MVIHDIIWDAGGTLFNTYPALTQALSLALREYGVNISETRILTLALQSTQHAIHTLAAEAGLEAFLFEDAFRRHYDAVGPKAQPPFPGVIEVCRAIRARGGRNFIVTHRKRDSLNALLAAHSMTHLFSDAITGEDPFPRKPDPAALNALASRHALTPNTTLLVGDRLLDLEAGRAAGMLTCLFESGPLSQPAPPVDLSITTFQTLLTLLQQTSSATS